MWGSWKQRVQHWLGMKRISRMKAEEKSQDDHCIAGLESSISRLDDDKSTQKRFINLKQK